MKRTNLFLAIPFSLYSKSFYQEVGKSWIGRSFFYLFLLLVLCWIPIALVSIHSISELASMALEDIGGQLPVLHIQQGVITSESKTPTLIRWSKNPELAKQLKANLFAIIDTQKQIKNFDKSSALVLVTDKEIYVKHLGKKLAKYELPKNLNMTVSSSDIGKILGKMKGYLYGIGGLLIYCFGLALSYIRYVLFGLIYAVVGLVFNSHLKRRLDYGNLLGLSLVAFSPVILIKMLFFVFDITFPFITLVYYIIPVIYVYWGIKVADQK